MSAITSSGPFTSTVDTFTFAPSTASARKAYVPTENPPATMDRSEAVQKEIDRLSLDGDLAKLRQDPNVSNEDFIKFLRNIMTPVRLSTKWVGSKRAIDSVNQARVASTLNADADMISSHKNLYDFKADRWTPIKKVRQAAINLWQRMSIDYPSEDGIRLIRRELIEPFRAEMTKLQQDLQNAAIELNTKYNDILEDGRLRLGDTFNAADYPPDFLSSFAIVYSFPSVETAAEIKNLNPQLWMDECARVRENLDNALYQAEEAYLNQFNEMIETLLGKLEPNEDGSKKIFRNTALTNIIDLVEQFKKTNIGSSHKMKQLVEQLQNITGNTTAEYLRNDRNEREEIKKNLATMKEAIQKMQLEDKEERYSRVGMRRIQTAASDERNFCDN